MGTVKALVKAIVIAVGLVLIGIGVAGIFAITQIESTGRRTIESTLSHVYQTQVSLGRVSVSFRERSLVLHELIIFNPLPFEEGVAMAFPVTSISFELGTVFDDVPAVDRIVLRDAIVNLRYEAGTGTNLRAIYAAASRERYTAGADTRGVKRHCTVNELRCESAILNASSNFAPGGALKLTLDPFTLNDLGLTDPVNTADIAALFVRSLFTQGLTVKGVAGPVVKRIEEEIQALKNDDTKFQPKP
ncbi:MAG: hypothetical protein AMXMBFR84_11950 [Candidatus Hydrogenedentota bacterium]